MSGPIQYPSGDDYANALRNAKRCLRDRSLHDFAPKLLPNGDPKPWTGGLAYVFKLEHPSGDVAVKFFKNGDEERANRYRLIDAHLSKLNCPYLVGFQYQPLGLKWPGDFPLLRMEWGGGKTLYQWLKEWGAAPKRDSAALLAMSDRWVALMQWLGVNQIAHGDLQHGNILVMADGPLVLVDYDGMCVPAMVTAGMRSREDGLPAYQHPQRLASPKGPEVGDSKGGQAASQQPERLRLLMSLEMDDFSAWVVWLTLRGLAADPGLWDKFNDPDDDHMVLFSPADLQRPGESALWKKLLNSPDAEVRERARPLFDSLGGPIAEVPRFRFDPLEELVAELQKVSRDWDAIATLADAALAAGRPLPPEVQVTADEARARRDSRERLRKAVASGNTERIASAYEPSLVDDWPACRQLVAVANLAVSLKRTTGGRDFLLLWEQHKALPDATAFRADAERWTRRLAALEKLKAALARRAGEAETVAAWHELQGAGGHPEMTAAGILAAACDRGDLELVVALAALNPPTGGLADRVREARTQVEARRRLGEVLKSGSIRRVAKAELPKLLADWAAGPEQLGKASAALELLKHLPGLEAAAVEPGNGRELLRLWGRYEDVPPGWQELDEARRVVDAWRPRVEAAAEVLRVVAGGRFRAEALVEAWQRLRKVKGHPDADSYQELARKSEERLRCLERLAKVPAAIRENADRALVGEWKEDVLGDWWEGDIYRERLAKARGRLDLHEALARSIAARAPDAGIVEAAEKLPEAYLSSPDLARGVAEAAGRLAQFEAVDDALKPDRPSDPAIAAAWDACGPTVRTRFSPEQQDRCHLAERRRAALAELRRPAPPQAADVADEATLRIWREGDLGDCHDLTPEERYRHGLASRRDQCWRDLGAALEGGRHAETRALMADPVLANYPPFVERRAAMLEALEESAHQAAILAYLAAGGPDEMLDSLELAGVEAHPNLYRSHADGLRSLLERAIGTASLREIALPEFDREADGRLRAVRLRLGWSWRRLGLGDRLCLVAAHPERFLDHPREGRPYTAEQQPTSRRGVLVATPDGAKQVYVTLWPVLKLRGLGLQAVGKPLHRGPFAVHPEEKAAGSWLGRLLKRGARGA